MNPLRSDKKFNQSSIIAASQISLEAHEEGTMLMVIFLLQHLVLGVTLPPFGEVPLTDKDNGYIHLP